MSNNDKLAFVITRLDDIGYPAAPAIKIFSDGRVEGLEGKFTTSNRIPMLIGIAKDEEARRVLGMSKTQDRPPGQIIGVEQQAKQAACATEVKNAQMKEGAVAGNTPTSTPPPVDHVMAFFDGMDKLFKEHFEPLFGSPRRHR